MRRRDRRRAALFHCRQASSMVRYFASLFAVAALSGPL